MRPPAKSRVKIAIIQKYEKTDIGSGGGGLRLFSIDGVIGASRTRQTSWEASQQTGRQAPRETSSSQKELIQVVWKFRSRDRKLDRLFLFQIKVRTGAAFSPRPDAARGGWPSIVLITQSCSSHLAPHG
jgi:hypothetical protein